MASLTADDICQGSRPVFIQDASQFVCNLTDRLVPGYPFKPIPHPFQRIKQAVGMVLVIADIQALAAGVALAVQVVLVAPAFDDLIVFDANFQPA